MALTDWRFHFSTSTTGGNTLTISEIELRSSVGGANLATDATKITCSANGHTPEKAIDGSLTSFFWASGKDAWVNYALDSSIAVVECVIRSENSTLYGRAPTYVALHKRSPSGYFKPVMVDFDLTWFQAEAKTWAVAQNPTGIVGARMHGLRTSLGLPSTAPAPVPIADFSFQVGSSGPSSPVNFTNLSINCVSYEWDFGDGSAVETGVNPSHTFASAGSYTVTLTGTAQDGSTSTATKTVNVVVPVDAIFNVTTGSVVVNTSVAFTNASTGAVSYAWTFGDSGTSTATNPTHTYTSTGTFTVTLTATGADGSTDSYSATVTVIAVPVVAGFTVNASTGTAPLSVTTTNTSTGASSYDWDFGDGSAHSTSTSPTHSYTTAGTYTLSLTATGAGGTSTVSKTITVQGAGVAPTIQWSDSSDRSSPKSLASAAFSSAKNIYAFVTDVGQTKVEFFLDNPTPSAPTGTPTHTEGLSPWDYAGTASDGSCLPTATNSFSNGSHNLAVRVTMPDTSLRYANSSFSVSIATGTVPQTIVTPLGYTRSLAFNDEFDAVTDADGFYPDIDRTKWGSTSYGTGSYTGGTRVWQSAIAAWAASHAYAVGAKVQNNGNAYTCVSAGTSAGSGGPTTTGSGIADGSVVWDFMPDAGYKNYHFWGDRKFNGGGNISSGLVYNPFVFDTPSVLKIRTTHFTGSQFTAYRNWLVNQNGRPAPPDLWGTGWLSTVGKFFAKNFYMECRCKIPPNKGVFPSFWALPYSTSGGLGQNAEIDIFEFLGGGASGAGSSLSQRFTNNLLLDAEATKSVTSISRSGTTATVTLTAHGYATGNTIKIAGASPAGYNGTFTITKIDANSFSYTVVNTLTTPATGTITAQRVNNTGITYHTDVHLSDGTWHTFGFEWDASNYCFTYDGAITQQGKTPAQLLNQQHMLILCVQMGGAWWKQDFVKSGGTASNNWDIETNTFDWEIDYVRAYDTLVTPNQSVWRSGFNIGTWNPSSAGGALNFFDGFNAWRGSPANASTVNLAYLTLQNLAYRPNNSTLGMSIWIGSGGGDGGTGYADWYTWVGNKAQSDMLWNFQISPVGLQNSVPQSTYDAAVTAAAGGSNDAAWYKIGQSHAQNGMNSQNCLLCIGHEFNGTWFKWNPGTVGVPTYATMLQRLVDNFRAGYLSVLPNGNPSQISLNFAANPDPVKSATYSISNVWDLYNAVGWSRIDNVGVHNYDHNGSAGGQNPSDWNFFRKYHNSIAFASDNARAHGKTLFCGEWDIVNAPNPDSNQRPAPTQDNTTFIQMMYNFFNDNRYHSDGVTPLLIGESMFQSYNGNSSETKYLYPRDVGSGQITSGVPGGGGLGWTSNSSTKNSAAGDLYKSLWSTR